MPGSQRPVCSSFPSSRTLSARSSRRCYLCGRHRKPKSGRIKSHICRSGELETIRYWPSATIRTMPDVHAELVKAKRKLETDLQKLLESFEAEPRVQCL